MSIGSVSNTSSLVHPTSKARSGKKKVPVWSEDQGTEGGGGREVGFPLPSRLGGLGSVMSSPSRVRSRAPAENNFGAF